MERYGTGPRRPCCPPRARCNAVVRLAPCRARGDSSLRSTAGSCTTATRAIRISTRSRATTERVHRSRHPSVCLSIHPMRASPSILCASPSILCASPPACPSARRPVGLTNHCMFGLCRDRPGTLRTAIGRRRGPRRSRRSCRGPVWAHYGTQRASAAQCTRPVRALALSMALARRWPGTGAGAFAPVPSRSTHDT